MLQFTLNGRLATDPTPATYGPDAADMLRLRIASNNPGSERTDFYDVAIFDPAAIETIRAARKGDTIKLSGVGSQNVWHTDDGDRRENISLVARTVVDHTPTARNAATPQTTARTVAAEAGR